MDPAKAALIAETERRIAIHRTVIANLERMGRDASAYRRQLAADERFLAEGITDPGPKTQRIDDTIGISAAFKP